MNFPGGCPVAIQWPDLATRVYRAARKKAREAQKKLEAEQKAKAKVEAEAKAKADAEAKATFPDPSGPPKQPETCQLGP